MCRQSTFFGIVIAGGLAALLAAPAASWGQADASGFYTGGGVSADSGDSSGDAYRLPSTNDGDVSPVSADMPASSSSPNARIAALEAKIAELDSALKDPPASKGYVVGSDTALLGKWTPNGPTFRSKNGDFIWKMRIVAQLDTVGIQNPYGEGRGGVGNPGIPGGAGARLDHLPPHAYRCRRHDVRNDRLGVGSRPGDGPAKLRPVRRCYPDHGFAQRGHRRWQHGRRRRGPESGRQHGQRDPAHHGLPDLHAIAGDRQHAYR